MSRSFLGFAPNGHGFLYSRKVRKPDFPDIPHSNDLPSWYSTFENEEEPHIEFDLTSRTLSSGAIWRPHCQYKENQSRESVSGTSSTTSSLYKSETSSFSPEADSHGSDTSSESLASFNPSLDCGIVGPSPHGESHQLEPLGSVVVRHSMLNAAAKCFHPTATLSNLNASAPVWTPLLPSSTGNPTESSLFTLTSSPSLPQHHEANQHNTEIPSSRLISSSLSNNSPWPTLIYNSDVMWSWYDDNFHEQAITTYVDIEADGLGLNSEPRLEVSDKDYDEIEEFRATIATAKRDLVVIPEVGMASGFVEMSLLVKIPGLLGVESIKEADDYVLTKDLTRLPIMPRTIVLNTGEQITVPQRTVPVDMSQIFEKTKSPARPDSPLKHCETITYEDGDISAAEAVVQKKQQRAHDSIDDKSQQEDHSPENEVLQADCRGSSTKLYRADYEGDDESQIKDAILYNEGSPLQEPEIAGSSKSNELAAQQESGDEKNVEMAAHLDNRERDSPLPQVQQITNKHPQLSVRPGGGPRIPRSPSIKTHEGAAEAFMNECKRLDQQAVRARRLTALRKDDNHAVASNDNQPLLDDNSENCSLPPTRAFSSCSSPSGDLPSSPFKGPESSPPHKIPGYSNESGDDSGLSTIAEESLEGDEWQVAASPPSSAPVVNGAIVPSGVPHPDAADCSTDKGQDALSDSFVKGQSPALLSKHCSSSDSTRRKSEGGEASKSSRETSAPNSRSGPPVLPPRTSSLAATSLVPALATTVTTTADPSLDRVHDFSLEVSSSAAQPSVVQESCEERTTPSVMPRRQATPAFRAAWDREYAENWWARAPEQVAQLYGDGTQVQDTRNDEADETTPIPTPRLVPEQEDEDKEKAAAPFIIGTPWQRRRRRIAARWFGEVEHKLQKRNSIGDPSLPPLPAAAAAAAAAATNDEEESEGKNNLFSKVKKAIFGLGTGKKKKKTQSEE